MDKKPKQTFDEVIANDVYKEEKQQILDEFLSNDMYKLNKICRFLVSKKGAPLMHEDDLYSLGCWVFLESVISYNPSKECKFSTYLEGNIWRAFYDWTRDNTRWKRCNLQTDTDGNLMRDENNNPIIIPDIPIDAPTEDGVNLSERVASDFDIENVVSEDIGFLLDDKVEEFLSELPKTAREVILMKMNNIPIEDIKRTLGISNSEYSNCMRVAKTNEKLELFTKSFITKEDNIMCESMPIDTTDNYRMDKNPLGGLLDEKRDGDINCKYILQRKAFQWTKRQKNKFLTRVLNNQPIPEIVICEQYVNGKKKRHLIDGLQRLSYAGLYRAKGVVIELDGAEFYEIQYEEKEYDEQGNPVFDEDGDIKKTQKVFNVIGKKFDELPKFLQDRFNKFNINVTTYFDCTDDQIAYHIRNYNNHEGMTSNQYEVTNIDIEKATMLKNITGKHPFFKDRYGNYTEKNDSKGVLERVVVESIIATNFLDNWKKKSEDAFEFINLNATAELFEDFKESLDRLCAIVNKENKRLFSTTNSPVWFSVFSRFKKFNLPDRMFADFMSYFIDSLGNLESDGDEFISVYRNSSTKDKSVVVGKIEGVTKLMKEFLHIDMENREKTIQEVSEPMTDSEFINKNVGVDIESVYENMDLYIDSLDDLLDNTIKVGSKLLEPENRQSLLAMVAYSYEEDKDLDDWLKKYAENNNTYLKNQKENYLHMVESLEDYNRELDKRAV